MTFALRHLLRSFRFPRLRTVYEDTYNTADTECSDGRSRRLMLSLCKPDAAADTATGENEAHDEPAPRATAVASDDVLFQVLPMSRLLFCQA